MFQISAVNRFSFQKLTYLKAFKFYLILTFMSHLYSCEINFLLVESFEDVLSIHFAHESEAGTGSRSM